MEGSRGKNTKINEHKLDKIRYEGLSKINILTHTEAGIIEIFNGKGGVSGIVPLGDIFSNEEINRMDQIRKELKEGKRKVE